jgi:hypothetical protein
MPSIIDSLNNMREVTISIHHEAALAELKEKVENEPLKTNFHIRAGCVSDEVSGEIVRRLIASGIQATFVPSGFFSSRYIDVNVSLPKSLEPEKKEEVNA